MVAKAAGGFAGGFFNNPGVVAIVGGLGALAIALIFFSKDIRNFFGSLEAPSLPDISITLPEIKFPEITFPEFPTIEFPPFEFPNIFGPPPPGGAVDGEITPGDIDVPGGTVTIPPGQTVDPDTGIVMGPPPTIESTTGMGTDISTLFGELVPQVFDTLQDAFGLSPAEAFAALKNVTTIEGLNEVLQSFNLAGIQEPAEVMPVAIPPQEPVPIITDVPGEFFGGGVSFGGGSIFPVGTGLSQENIAELSLSDIIDLFGVTASQAADIKAQAIGFEDVGGFIPPGFFEEPDVGGFIGGGPPAVSDPQFEGLTPEQIFQMLVGGNISNF